MNAKLVKDNYIKVPNYEGIYKHKISGKYQARKKIGTKNNKQSFNNLRDALSWFRLFNGKEEKSKPLKLTATLSEVWAYMQKHHFPILARSTIDVWKSRFKLLESLEDYQMHEITYGVISSWVSKTVLYYRSDEYLNGVRGNAKRCNLNNELNMFITIFNYYRKCDAFAVEANGLTNPVNDKHKNLGCIRVKPKINRAIGVEDAFNFFANIEPLYRDLLQLQYYTASRIAEVAGLQWKRVNFERRELLIMETCYWDRSNKHFVSLNPHPKNKEGRQVYITDQIMEILKRMECHKIEGCGFVFHNQGKPLNYSVIQKRAETARRRSGVPHTGTHIFRHGMATLAREVGGLDAVIAMTGHKDIKLADHYSKNQPKLQKDISIKIMNHIHGPKVITPEGAESTVKVIPFKKLKLV